MKNKSKIIAFRPEDDVKDLLEAAQKNGLTLSEVVNKSVREFGGQVIADLAKQQIGRLKLLTRKPSFNGPERQIAGELNLAA